MREVQILLSREVGGDGFSPRREVRSTRRVQAGKYKMGDYVDGWRIIQIAGPKSIEERRADAITEGPPPNFNLGGCDE